MGFEVCRSAYLRPKLIDHQIEKQPVSLCLCSGLGNVSLLNRGSLCGSVPDLSRNSPVGAIH